MLKVSNYFPIVQLLSSLLATCGSLTDECTDFLSCFCSDPEVIYPLELFWLNFPLTLIFSHSSSFRSLYFSALLEICGSVSYWVGGGRYISPRLFKKGLFKPAESRDVRESWAMIFIQKRRKGRKSDSWKSRTWLSCIVMASREAKSCWKEIVCYFTLITWILLCMCWQTIFDFMHLTLVTWVLQCLGAYSFPVSFRLTVSGMLWWTIS